MAGRPETRLKVGLQRLLAALSAAIACTFAHGQFPARPVRVVIPFPPGGPTDVLGRLVAQKMAESTGQGFVIENRAGGNATIGPVEVEKSAPDGYTLLFNASIFTITPLLSTNVPYNVYRGFTPIALIAKGPIALAVTAALPVKNVNDLINYAKLHPGKLAFGIGSSGSAGHLATEMLRRAAGIDILIVPYKGSTPAYQDLIGGQIQGFMDPVLGAQPHWKSGRIKVLAVTSERRLPSTPDTPTMAETLRGFEIYSWYGLWGPANLSRDVRFTLNAEANKALFALRQRLVDEGYELTIGSPEEFAIFQRADMALSAKIIREAGIKAE
jgi:tripartite-type tricarboxylate transporter receptor subunit TctC